MKNKNCGNHTQAMTATLFRHLNEQGYKFHDNDRDCKSRTLFVGGERCPGQKTKVYDLSGHERIRQRADDGNALKFNTMLDTQG